MGVGLFVWAVAVDVCLFCAWTSGHAGVPSGAHWTSYLAAIVLTAIAGLWTGWRRRVGSAFAAPLLAWALLVPFAFVSGFLTDGFFGGLLRGLALSVVGGFVASFFEGLVLVASSVVGRLAAARGSDRDGVTILPPGSR